MRLGANASEGTNNELQRSGYLKQMRQARAVIRSWPGISRES
jgi:hypothetical protein